MSEITLEIKIDSNIFAEILSKSDSYQKKPIKKEIKPDLSSKNGGGSKRISDKQSELIQSLSYKYQFDVSDEIFECFHKKNLLDLTGEEANNLIKKYFHN